MAKLTGTIGLCFYVTLLLFGLMNLGLGCAEAYYLHEYADTSDGCREIWKWILSDCVFSFVTSVLGCCGIGPSGTEIIQCAQLGSLIIAIWCAVVYNNISQSCLDYWNANGPELVTFVRINYILLLIACSIVGLSIVLGCCVGISSVSRDEKGEKLQKNTNSGETNIV
jgi:hypothetical protein